GLAVFARGWLIHDDGLAVFYAWLTNPR
ncbi:hypothetical protein EVA_14222, partial [gut metagenome]